MANASQFIGSKISLISKSEIRYEGILYSLNVAEATISLARVKSFGTEGRDTERPVPPKDEVYEFIIFRGSDIKGIDVVEPPKPAPIVNEGLPNDPAIVEVSHYHSPARPPPPHSNIGPVPVQVQASSAYNNAMSGTSYGSSGYGGASSSTSAPLPKPVPSHHQPTRITTMSGALGSDLPESSIKFEANDLNETSGSNVSTPAFSTSNLKHEGESQAKLPYGRGNARGQGQGQGFQRGGGGGEERSRGGRGGGGRGYGGNRGKYYGSESAEGQESTGPQRRQGQEGGHSRQEPIGQQRQEATGHQRQEAVGHQRQQHRQDAVGHQRQGQEGTGNQQRSSGEEGTGEQRQQNQSYQRRSSGGGGGNYNNNPSREGGGGYRGGRGGYRPNRTQGILRAPQSAKVTFDNDFDFEKANEELQSAIKDLKMTEKANELAAAESNGGDQLVHSHETEEQENKEPQTCYKKDDFFDSISCEALEREKGASNRPDWRAERKLNAETFGLTGRGRGGGYYRGGGRGYYNNRGGGYGYGYGYGGGRGYGGHRGGNSRDGGGGGGYSSYNNRYNNGGGGRRGRGASNANPEGTVSNTNTQGSGSF